MKKMILFAELVIFSLTGAGEVLSSSVAHYAIPPAVNDSELSEFCTWDDLGYKIHGKNGQPEKFECKSFEKNLEKGKQYEALKYGYFSKFAYYGKSEYVNKIKSTAGADVSAYKLLPDAEIENIISGTSLMVKDRSIISKKDENLYDKDDKNGRLDGHSEGGSTRFDAKIFVKRDEGGKIIEVVISYRGTQFKNPRDWWDDVKQAAGGVPDQYRQASELLRVVLNSDLFSGAQIVCTGHSLGGGLVTYAMADNDLSGRVRGYTYDAAGLSGKTLDSLKNNIDRVIDASHSIINVRAVKDPVSYVGYHLGKMYQIDVGEDKIVKNHDLDKLIAAMEKIPCKSTDANNGQVCKPGDSPFDSEPDNNGGGNGQICPVPGGGGSSGGAYSGGVRSPKPTSGTSRIRRGGGGDTKARIYP